MVPPIAGMGGTPSRIRMARCLLPRAPDHPLISEVHRNLSCPYLGS
jgi:hypothetical protein